MSDIINMHDLCAEITGKILFVGSSIYDWNRYSRVCKFWKQLFDEHISKSGVLYFHNTDKLVLGAIDPNNMHFEILKDDVRLWMQCQVMSHGFKRDCEIAFIAPKQNFNALFSGDALMYSVVTSEEYVTECLLECLNTEIYGIVSCVREIEVSFKINDNEYRATYNRGVMQTFTINNSKCISHVMMATISEIVRATIYPAIINTFGNIFPKDAKLGSGEKYLFEMRDKLHSIYSTECYHC